MRKGTVLYTLHPYGPRPGNYFSDAANVLGAKGKARAYNDSLQVAHAENTPGLKPMRNEVQGFVVMEDICVAKGTTRANPELGAGGGTQYFVMDKDKATLLPSRVMKMTSK